MCDREKMLNINKRGYTLAEVLIALALLGVVAAYSIPKLLQQHTVNQRYMKAVEGVTWLQQSLSQFSLDVLGGNHCLAQLTCAVDASGNPLDGLPAVSTPTVNPQAYQTVINYLDRTLNYLEKTTIGDETAYVFPNQQILVLNQITGYCRLNSATNERGQAIQFTVFVDRTAEQIRNNQFVPVGVDGHKVTVLYVLKNRIVYSGSQIMEFFGSGIPGFGDPGGLGIRHSSTAPQTSSYSPTDYQTFPQYTCQYINATSGSSYPCQ